VNTASEFDKAAAKQQLQQERAEKHLPAAWTLISPLPNVVSLIQAQCLVSRCIW